MRAARFIFAALTYCLAAAALGVPATGSGAEVSDWAALAAKRLPLLKPCFVPGVEESLLCGTLEVWENREAASGRKIGLKVVVVPATREKPPNDPVVILAGGPGGVATKRAAASTHAQGVRARDILLIDQRGTGSSNELDCDLDGAAAPGELAELYPTAGVARCAQALASRADLLRYGSATFADDVEEVRQRLGYGALNLHGASYGTRAMMVFAQRYPASVRSLFGIGVDTPLRSNLAERGVTAQAGLEALARSCAAESVCRALTPDLAASAARLLARVEKAPVEVRLPAGAAGGSAQVLLLRRPWLSEQLRTLLYFSHTARALPWAFHRAELGDWVPLTRLALGIENWFRSGLAEGLTLAVLCSEQMGFDLEAARRRGQATIFGSDRLEQQLQGCAAWPHRPVPSLGIETPRPLPIPTLLLSGALDPVTPPGYAEDARTLFPQSRHVVVEQGHHGFFELEGAWGCVHRVWADFLDRGSVEGLKTSCLEKLPGPPFATDAARFEAYLKKAFSA